MKAVILQSGYMPWLGYFDLIDKAGVFVFFDDVQWTTRDWRNRNRIRTAQGWSWLTVPVRIDRHHIDYEIKDVQIDQTQNWRLKHLRTLRAWYSRSPYFDEIYPILDRILNTEQRFLVDLNYATILSLCEYMSISGAKFVSSQSLNLCKDIRKTERLIAVIQELQGVETYISGDSARAYLKEDEFQSRGIGVEWHGYRHPYYSQLTWDSHIFVPYLSIVDLLFNHGKESLGILTGRKAVPKPEHIRIVPPEELN